MHQFFKEAIKFNPKLVFFAITNNCNCKCGMCSIWKIKEKKNIELDKAKSILLDLKKRGFNYLQLTGGEPMLHPNFFEILEYAKKLKFVVFFPTNGTLIDKISAKKLSKMNIDNVSVSFHNMDPLKFEDIAGHKDIFYKSLSAIKNLKKEKIPTCVICTINRKTNCEDIEHVVEFFQKMSIFVLICTPMVIKDTSFHIGGDDTNFSDKELKNIIIDILKMKKKYSNIINNTLFLETVIDFLDKKKTKYPCLGGKKILYIDWDGIVYPCMTKNELTENCDDCILECFREPSIFMSSRKNAIFAIAKDLKYYLQFLKDSGIKL